MDKEITFLPSTTHGSSDGFFTKYVYRKIGRYIVPIALKCRLTPNFVTFLSLIVGIFASLMILFNSLNQIFQNKIIFQISVFMLINSSYILDVVDGQIARALKRTTEFGAWIDSLFDKINDLFLIFCAAISLYINKGGIFNIILGELAIISLLLLFYVEAISPRSYSSKEGLENTATGIFKKFHIPIRNPYYFAFSQETFILLFSFGILFDTIEISLLLLIFLPFIYMILRSIMVWNSINKNLSES